MITVQDMIRALSRFEEDKPVYVALLGKENAAVFNGVALGENGGGIQISAFAEEDTDGVSRVPEDLQEHEWDTSHLPVSDE